MESFSYPKGETLCLGPISTITIKIRCHHSQNCPPPTFKTVAPPLVTTQLVLSQFKNFIMVNGELNKVSLCQKIIIECCELVKLGCHINCSAGPVFLDTLYYDMYRISFYAVQVALQIQFQWLLSVTLMAVISTKQRENQV